MTFVPGVGYFVLVVEVPPGQYYYRFVVDGRWRVAEGDPNLREDPFGEMSHHLLINSKELLRAKSTRFSTAALSRVDLPRDSAGAPVSDDEESDGDSEGEHSDVSDDEEEAEEGPAMQQFEPERLPRHRGEEFINDYDDDENGELDLQADVFEAMFDVKQELSEAESKRLLVPPGPSRQPPPRRRKPAGKMMIRNVFAKLFGKDVAGGVDGAGTYDGPQPDGAPVQGYKGVGRAPDAILRQVEEAEKPKKRLRVWFPTERNFPALRGAGRRVQPKEEERVRDATGTALRFNLAEENANSRQQLGKTLFAQGKYDAALALFSLSVKIREDNGLRNAKTTAVAHTDVASAFIHLGDLKNADKHLNAALSIYDRKAFSGGQAELGDIHCFQAVVCEMRGTLKDAEKSYRAALHLYQQCGSPESNPNYATARENLRDNLRRQKEAPSQPAPPPMDVHRDSSPVSSTYDSDTMARETDKENSNKQQRQHPKQRKLLQRSKVKPIMRQSPRDKPQVAGPTPQTLSTINSFPDSEMSMSPASNSRQLDPAALAAAPINHQHASPDSITLPPTLDDYRGERKSKTQGRRSSRPTTWKALAEVARASMPVAPLDESAGNGTGDTADDEDASGLGTYEEMSRGWQRDGRKFLAGGSYTEAIDMYTLAIYTRKRHGPWASKANAETHVEYARALFATSDVAGAAGTLRDAIGILEKLDNAKNDLMLGQVWGNLGSALDRLGGHIKDAETAHCAGLVAYARAGVDKNDPKWTKAWKNLCLNNRAQGAKARPIGDVWHGIDQEIRGVIPMTCATSVKIHG